ncbi:MucBP domain-containing protein [Alkalibacillus almallahensis]|uniref:MucBP domain-containing protein n=1 Tax=Alkalibacillus almallahensis TaxID=1379154 RepID=UPI00141E23B9|nr:MucBP domain-containing protein [Alkalibacillus almallahensis]NIK13177.1 LPXTG-motif cell wall-anchored protein [Alkalibacillus almallahensis]
MKHVKIVSLMSILLLLANPILPSITASANSMFSQDGNKFTIQQVDHSQDSIQWKVTMLVEEGSENSSTASINFGNGLSFGQVVSKTFNGSTSNFDVSQSGSDYQVKLPVDPGLYQMTFTTAITNQEVANFKFKVDGSYQGVTAFDEVKIVPDINVDLTIQQKWIGVPDDFNLPNVEYQVHDASGNVTQDKLISGSESSFTFSSLSKYTTDGTLNQYSPVSLPVDNFETERNGNVFTHTYMAPKEEDTSNQDNDAGESGEEGSQEDSDPDPAVDEEKPSDEEDESNADETESKEQQESSSDSNDDSSEQAKEQQDELDEEKDDRQNDDKASIDDQEDSKGEKPDDGSKEESDESLEEESNESLEAFFERIAKLSVDELSDEDVKRIEGLNDQQKEQLLTIIGEDAGELPRTPGFKEEGMLSHSEVGPPGGPPSGMMRSFESQMLNPHNLEPGELNLDKTASPTGNDAEWEVELNIEGRNLSSSSDIVLVLDESGSMGDGNRMNQMQASANEFVDSLLLQGSNNRISIVSFSESSTVETGLTGFSGKNNLKSKINSLSAYGGTNIQAGIKSARDVLNNSSADKQVIVLLSDGEPTYSYEASTANSSSWTHSSYNFELSGFNYNDRVGSGSSYSLGDCFFGIFCNGPAYYADGYAVETNGIGTISEARHTMNQGYSMYSIGFGVGGNNNAENVLKDSQNAGYYVGGNDDLSSLFSDISSDIAYAAQDAIVTDPLGDYFDIADGFDPNTDVEVSQGSVSFDENTETFTWDIGTITEADPPWMKYKVKMDLAKNPDSDTLYPTNGDTPLNYTNIHDESATEYFDVPEVSIGPGTIEVKGYRVNIDGDPIDANGNVVGNPSLAESLYNVFHQENNSDALPFNTSYNVVPQQVNSYQFSVGDDPTDVELLASEPHEVVWFGYVAEGDLEGGTVTAGYVDQNGNAIADPESFNGLFGETYETEQKDIDGYRFVEVTGAPPTGEFTADEQTVTYVYEKVIGSLTINKVDQDGELITSGEAEFQLKNGDNEVIATATTTDGVAVIEDLELGDYWLVETKAPEGYQLNKTPIEVTISDDEEDEEHQKLDVVNNENGWEIPETGGVGANGFYLVGTLLMLAAGFVLWRRKRQAHE